LAGAGWIEVGVAAPRSEYLRPVVGREIAWHACDEAAIPQDVEAELIRAVRV